MAHLKIRNYYLFYCLLLWNPLVVFSDSNVWSCDQLDFCDDKPGFEAIRWLHHQLDDDANGNVDIVESDEFLRDELKYENGHERHKAFHGNDKHISVDELWRSWKVSQVHNWTKEETADWLINYVELPQYADLFINNNVDGTKLPRLASNTQQLTISLGIKDPVHRQKIALKAMDVVLFGPPKQHHFIKDCILAFSLLIAVVGCWFAIFQHKRSQEHLKKMLKDMESLSKAEEQLTQMQNELEKAQQEQRKMIFEKQNLEEKLKASQRTVSTEKGELTSLQREGSLPNVSDNNKIAELEEELRDAKEQLTQALATKSWMPPPKLQYWLKLTYEKESRHFEIKRKAATFQLESAKKACEKLNKTRSGFLGSFRVAHGSVIDDVDSRILQAKASLAEVTSEIQERSIRWKEIEQLCGFSVASWSNFSRNGSQIGFARTNSENTLRDSMEGSELNLCQNYSAGSQSSVPLSLLTRTPEGGSRVSLPPSLMYLRKNQLSNSFNAGHLSEAEYNGNDSEESDEARATFTLGDGYTDVDVSSLGNNMPPLSASVGFNSKSMRSTSDNQPNSSILSNEIEKYGKPVLAKPLSTKDLLLSEKPSAAFEKSACDSSTLMQNSVTKAKRISELGQSYGGDTDDSMDLFDTTDLESSNGDSISNARSSPHSSSCSDITVKAHNSGKKKKGFVKSLLRKRKPAENHD